MHCIYNKLYLVRVHITSFDCILKRNSFFFFSDNWIRFAFSSIFDEHLYEMIYSTFYILNGKKRRRNGSHSNFAFDNGFFYKKKKNIAVQVMIITKQQNISRDEKQGWLKNSKITNTKKKKFLPSMSAMVFHRWAPLSMALDLILHWNSCRSSFCFFFCIFNWRFSTLFSIENKIDCLYNWRSCYWFYIERNVTHTHLKETNIKKNKAHITKLKLNWIDANWIRLIFFCFVLQSITCQWPQIFFFLLLCLDIFV